MRTFFLPLVKFRKRRLYRFELPAVMYILPAKSVISTDDPNWWIMIPISYWKIAEQNYCSINDKATYPFFISNEFTDFLDSIWFFLIVIYVIEKKNVKILKNPRNLTNFGYVFIARFHISPKNFPSDLSNTCTVIDSIFFQRQKQKYEFWKVNKLI